MQRIITKYHGPTNNLPTRISATASDAKKRIYMSRDTSIRGDEPHKDAANQTMNSVKSMHGSYLPGVC